LLALNPYPSAPQPQHEAKWTEQAINFFNDAAAQTGGGCSAATAAAGQQQQQHQTDGALLFDSIFEKAPDHRAPACSKVHRCAQCAS
jgi:hypothetical protein